MKSQPWTDKISNVSQLGGIETSVLDNGSGRGTRIAWVNTGTGLRYKVILDRCMDIGDAFYGQHSLAWLSHGGIMPPQPYAHQGTEWLKSFFGGLLTTCGLTHVGGPEEDEFGTRGLHDKINNFPAEIASIIQPDPSNGQMEMSISGTIKQTEVFGHRLELRRKIISKLGQSTIRIQDEVVNTGNLPAPHMILYHINFGWPLIDDGADIRWKGDWKSIGREMDDKIFREGNDFRKCLPPDASHNGTGEACGVMDVDTNPEGGCLCGISNSRIGLALAIRYQKKQLPWLTNWQHWGKREYVTALEPGTHPPIGQSAARTQQTLIFLEPGESRIYEVEIELMAEKDQIQSFINKTK